MHTYAVLPFDILRTPTAWRRRPIAAASLLGLALLLQAIALAQLGFSSTVSAGFLADLVQRFGPVAQTRVGRWQQEIRRLAVPAAGGSQRPTEKELLDAVNNYFNRNTVFVDDFKHWGVADYWASPAEFVASGGGDCEDYALAKYYALKELGVPIARLRIAYVKATRINQPHMVLTYYETADAEPLVLDNLEPTILPAAQRPDLLPVYSFNDEDLWMARNGGSARSGSASQIRMWRGLQDKLQHERDM